MRFAMLVMLVLAASVATANAKGPDPWQLWKTELQKQCPANHIDWDEGSGYDTLLAEFARELPRSTRQKIDFITQHSNRCPPGNTAGFGCEMADNLDAFNRLGLLKRFAAFGCRHYKCEEESLCTRFDSSVGRPR